MLADIVPAAALSLVAVLALTSSDYRGWRPGRYLFKPLAAIAFVWLALRLGATDSSYGSWLLAGLLCCLLGDLFLMPDDERTFLAGLTAFLCGHLLYCVAFWQLPASIAGAAVSAVPVLLLTWIMARWLLPRVQAGMTLPVLLYILVINAMLVSAGLTWGLALAPLVIIGAWGFALSDVAVARQQFVHRSRLNPLWGTPLYFLSQMLLASSVALW